MAAQPFVPGPCFPAGTQITLASGERLPIERVEVGELLRTAEGNVGRVLVSKKRKHVGDVVGVGFGFGTVLWGTPEHPVLTKGGYVDLSEIRKETAARYLNDWHFVKEVSRRPFDGDVYNLQVTGDESYVAEGVGVHNCPVFVGNSDSVITFLGFSRDGIDIDFDPNYAPYVVDYGGSVPTDYSYQGCAATVSMELPSWDESVYAILAAYAETGLNVPRGTEAFGSIGTLMGFEGAAVEMWLPFPYQAKTAYAQMVKGYHMRSVFIDRDSLPKRGARPATLNLTFRCIRALSNTNPSGTLGTSFMQLYDNDMSAVSGAIFNLNKP